MTHAHKAQDRAEIKIVRLKITKVKVVEQMSVKVVDSREISPKVSQV